MSVSAAQAACVAKKLTLRPKTLPASAGPNPSKTHVITKTPARTSLNVAPPIRVCSPYFLQKLVVAARTVSCSSLFPAVFSAAAA